MTVGDNCVVFERDHRIIGGVTSLLALLCCDWGQAKSGGFGSELLSLVLMGVLSRSRQWLAGLHEWSSLLSKLNVQLPLQLDLSAHVTCLLVNQMSTVK